MNVYEVIVMKKALIVLLCVLIVLPMSACEKSNAELGSALLSDAVGGETSIRAELQSTTSSASAGNSDAASSNNATSAITTERHRTEGNATTTKSSHSQESSYDDIICAEILAFQRVGFSIKNSNTMIHLAIPKEWELVKNKAGYTIVKNSQTIGNVTALGSTSSAGESVNVFLGEITVGGIRVTHSIDRVNSDKKPSYTRTLGYHYDDKKGNRNNINITVAYQEIDSSAVVTMMTEAEKSIASTEKNMGALQIRDNRNSILILGNSFVNTSQIGSILQTMCGSGVSVEAHSRGYASVATYTDDAYMMQNIRAGSYSAVFMCGLYSRQDVLELKKIVEACEDSDTKIAVFPAHNENRSCINDAALACPSAVLIDWKAEIDALIDTGVDYSYFCIADTHKHSTPLAGYVGAHMIYRAVFNKIPQTTSFNEVSKSQINLLGEYASVGAVGLAEKDAIYTIG